MTAYAELAVTTNFSFLRGASHPQEMVNTAHALGLTAIGIADRNSFAGVVRAYDAWKKIKAIRLLVGVRLVTVDGFEAIAYPINRTAYGKLCRLLTDGNRAATKGECHITLDNILAAAEGQIFIALPPQELSSEFTDRLATLVRAAPGRTYLAGGSACWTNWATNSARRSLPSTTHIIMCPNASPSPTCSPVSGKNAPSRTPVSVLPPMPNGTSSRRRK
jgi:error-prone DNA polymerase